MLFADPAALMFTTTVVGAVVSCLLLLSHVGIGDDGVALRLWATGDLLLTLYRVALLLQPGVLGGGHTLPWAPQQLVPAALAVLIAGVGLHGLALARLTGRMPARPATVLTGIGTAAMLWWLVAANLPFAILTTVWTMGSIAVLSGGMLVLSLPLVRQGTGAKLMAASLALITLNNSVLTAVWLVHPPVVSALQPGEPSLPPVQGLLMDFLASLFLTFSLVLMLQERLRARLITLSTTDPLTGALNRRGMVPLLAKEIERATRYQRPVSVALIDLDHFKRVNDQHGHERGDAVLALFAQHVQHRKRATDLLSRWGGEEFLLLMPETSPQAAFHAVDRLREHLSRSPLAPSLPVVTLSAGVACWSGAPSAEAVDALVGCADQALYAAKVSRNCVRLQTVGL